MAEALLDAEAVERAVALIGERPRSTGELCRKLCTTPSAVRAALDPLVAAGRLSQPSGGGWWPGGVLTSDGGLTAKIPAAPVQFAPPERASATKLQVRVLELIAAEPGILQSEAGRRLSAESRISITCKYLEMTGEIRRVPLDNSRQPRPALRLYMADNKKKTITGIRPPPVPEPSTPEEEPSGDCDGPESGEISAGAPRWDGDRLVALRPVDLGRVRFREGSWAWSALTPDGAETGDAPTEARARARVEQAIGRG